MALPRQVPKVAPVTFPHIMPTGILRGCLLPILAQTTGNAFAVIITTLLFAIFHEPGNLAHWVSSYSFLLNSLVVETLDAKGSCCGTCLQMCSPTTCLWRRRDGTAQAPEVGGGRAWPAQSRS